jgi:hypothetical protein
MFVELQHFFSTTKRLTTEAQRAQRKAMTNGKEVIEKTGAACMVNMSGGEKYSRRSRASPAFLCTLCVSVVVSILRFIM